MGCSKTILPGCFFLIFLIAGAGFHTVEAHEWMAPDDAAARMNPVPFSEESLARGKEVYDDKCVACHGDHREGLKAEDTGLSKNTPNLQQRLATHSEGDFFWKIQAGRNDMPAFKDELTEQEIWDVINYLKED